MHTVFRILIRFAGAFAVAYCAVWVFAPHVLQRDVLQGVNAFRAAEILRTNLETDRSQNKITTQLKDNVDEQDLFRALEATWPYAFSLRCTTHGNGLVSFEVVPENMAAQEQAALLAKGIAQGLITQDMSIRERLQVLHDYVVKHCVYDVEIAEQAALVQSNGADTAFTAAGALVDGKAVCSGYARAYMMLCAAAGMDMIYIADAGMNHGWNAVRLYDTIYYIDTTFDDPIPDRGEMASEEYFLQTKEQMRKTHQWDEMFYDELARYALPQSLATAQRLFDLGLLGDTPPVASALSQPLPAAQRVHLGEVLGVSFAQGTAAKEVYATAWAKVCQKTVLQKLIKEGVIAEKRADLVGLKYS